MDLDEELRDTVDYLMQYTHLANLRSRFTQNSYGIMFLKRHYLSHNMARHHAVSDMT